MYMYMYIESGQVDSVLLSVLVLSSHCDWLTDWSLAETSAEEDDWTWVYIQFCYCEKSNWLCDVFVVEVQYSSAWDAGDCADESVLDAVFHWLWRWWRFYIHGWQVEEFYFSSICCPVISQLVVVADTVWLAGVSNQTLGAKSTQEAGRTWVYTHIDTHSHSICLCRTWQKLLMELEVLWNLGKFHSSLSFKCQKIIYMMHDVWHDQRPRSKHDGKLSCMVSYAYDSAADFQFMFRCIRWFSRPGPWGTNTSKSAFVEGGGSLWAKY